MNITILKSMSKNSWVLFVLLSCEILRRFDFYVNFKRI